MERLGWGYVVGGLDLNCHCGGKSFGIFEDVPFASWQKIFESKGPEGYRDFDLDFRNWKGLKARFLGASSLLCEYQLQRTTK